MDLNFFIKNITRKLVSIVSYYQKSFELFPSELI